MVLLCFKLFISLACSYQVTGQQSGLRGARTQRVAGFGTCPGLREWAKFSGFGGLSERYSKRYLNDTRKAQKAGHRLLINQWWSACGPCSTSRCLRAVWNQRQKACHGACGEAQHLHPSCLLAFLPSCLTAFLPSCLPAFLPSCLPGFCLLPLLPSFFFCPASLPLFPSSASLPFHPPFSIAPSVLAPLLPGFLYPFLPSFFPSSFLLLLSLPPSFSSSALFLHSFSFPLPPFLDINTPVSETLQNDIAKPQKR